ncbi:PREDICTED: serine/arginine repetitive matrix protein 2-like [Chrysochloris asiatica]|uniref:Serine/arginine repetitive matrix protein 2-like n=1 Tax=Chrysochloris asiatica TaxID=185453 RepID=A0A9B0U311_CHRAS|nr:PREDICTED: serine/arginine repetitive matrix protein 2-like [Chrysochloris asiatica]
MDICLSLVPWFLPTLPTPPQGDHRAEGSLGRVDLALRGREVTSAGVPALRTRGQQRAAENRSGRSRVRAPEPSRAGPRARAQTPRDAAERSRPPVLLAPQVQPEPGAMASPSGSPEDAGQPRGRAGRPRWEEEDAPPEEKRLRLGPEEVEGGDAPRLGTEDTGTQTGGDGSGVSGARSGQGAAGRVAGTPPPWLRWKLVMGYQLRRVPGTSGAARCRVLVADPFLLL